MRCFCNTLPRALCALLAMLAATYAQGQAVRPAAETRDVGGPHKMEIYSGPNRTVRYFAGSVSSSEAAALRDLERTENQMAYVDGLLDLRRQYVDSERYLNINRAAVQDRLYGLSAQNNYGSYFNGSNYVGGISYPFYAAGGAYGFPGGSYGLSSSSQVSRSLEYGVGDEGRLKEALARTIAVQATPEYTAVAVREHQMALALASESDRTRKVAGLTGRGGRVTPVGFEQAAPATVVLKSGEKLEGNLLREDADWIVIQTPKEEVTVRKSEVNRIVKPSAPVKSERK